MKNAESSADDRTAHHSDEFKKPPSTEEMVKAARLLYIDGLGKEQICARMGISPHRLRWLLRQAKEKGIVRIDIYEPPGAALESMANALCQKFSLHKVIVTPCKEIKTEDQYVGLVRRWGFEAAAYLDKLADESGELHVGLSGGETNLEVMTALPDKKRENVHFYATALIGRGRLPVNASHVSPSTNATIGWARSGRYPGHVHFATVPPYDRSVGTRLAISHEIERLSLRKPIENVIRDMDAITVTFPGLGVVNPGNGNPAFAKGHINRLTMAGLLKPSGINPKELAAEGAVGDLSYCLFDREGNDRKDWRFFLTAGHYARKEDRRGIGFYRQMVKDRKKVIVIAGIDKVSAIRAALNGRLFNVLITDEISARELLEIHCPPPVFLVCQCELAFPIQGLHIRSTDSDL